MTEALKPCPFCGGGAVVGHHAKGRPGAWENAEDFWVYCDTDDCFVHVGMCETREVAIAAWNRRAPYDEAAETASWTPEKQAEYRATVAMRGVAKRMAEDQIAARDAGEGK